MPPPGCIVRRWGKSEPRETRFDTRDRNSSFFRKSESNSGIATSQITEPGAARAALQVRVPAAGEVQDHDGRRPNEVRPAQANAEAGLAHLFDGAVPAA